MKHLSPVAHLPPVACCLLATLLLVACNVAPPLTLGQKDSMANQGKVLTITNTSEKHLHEVVVQITGPEGEAKTFSVPTLNPHETLNVGWMKLEGWPIPPGAKVEVSCKDFLTPAGYTIQP